MAAGRIFTGTTQKRVCSPTTVWTLKVMVTYAESDSRGNPPTTLLVQVFGNVPVQSISVWLGLVSGRSHNIPSKPKVTYTTVRRVRVLVTTP